MSFHWSTIATLTDQTVLGLAGLSSAPPRRTARAILTNLQGLYAVMYAEKFGLYSLPGGGIEAGETELDALRRELLEETGCTCDTVVPLGIVSENRFHADYTSLSYYFVVKTNTIQGRIHLTDAEVENGTRLMWCSLEEMVRLISNANHDTNQRKFLQARDMAALKEYQLQRSRF